MYLDIYSWWKQGAFATTTVLTGSKCQVINGYYPADGVDDVTPVIDQFDIWLNGTEAENKAKLVEIRRALESAKKYKDTQRRAYIRYDPYGDDQPGSYQSRIISGRVLHNAKLIHQLKRNRMHLTLIIERDPWWESVDYSSIPLTNGNGTDNLTGLRIYNCGDNATVDTSYKRDNWATIDGVNDVEGDLPAPAYLSYYGGSSLSVHARTIHVFNNVNSYPSSYDPIIEAEEYGADTSLTGASAGYVGQFTITSGSENLFWYLDIDSQVEYASTGYFVALMRFKYDQISNLGNLKFKIELYEATKGTLFITDYFYPNGSTGEPVYAISPIFKLQTTEEDLLNPNGYVLRIYAYQETGASLTLVMDDIHIYPVEEYRKLGDDATDLRIGFDGYNYLDDVQPTGLCFEYNSSSILTFAISDRLGKLMIHPGVNQKLSWIFGMTTATTQTMINSSYLSVRLFYRPRRRTI
jgi:hypothetical protein